MVDLKELKRLIKYLRKEGITEFKNGDLEFKLGATPTKTRRSKSVPAGQNDVSEEVNIDTDAPTTEELLFWSSSGGQPITQEDN